MGRVAAADVGGTHARFAIAEIDGGNVVSVGEAATFLTADFACFEDAWKNYERTVRQLPRSAAVAIAGPVLGDRVAMTNSKWVLDIPAMRSMLGLEKIVVLNDFGAVAHAVAEANPSELAHIAGPDRPLPEVGTISVIGPGTGLGVAQLSRFAGGFHIQASEGGHVGFAPQGELEDSIVARLRSRYGRVVNEHVVSGPGIVVIHAALNGEALDERAIWERGIARSDEFAARTVDRFCAMLGSVAGDYALVHGAVAVVLAGSIGQRLGQLLPQSDFGERFRAKPRYEAMMANVPVKLLTQREPGLFGAAVAFAREYG